MAYNAMVVEVLIASPSDVIDERSIVRDELYHWNVVNARERSVILKPTAWESDSSPDLSDRPQQLINDRLLQHADVLVGIFRTRLGSPTGVASSGTVEEIQRHHQSGKTVMLYFSDAPVAPSKIDRDQFEALQAFKAWARGLGIFGTYETIDQFKELFRKQLPLTLRDNEYLKQVVRGNKLAAAIDASTATPLSADELAVLKAAVSDRNGMVAIRTSMNDISIGGGGVTFVSGNDLRGVERWRAVINSLMSKGFLRDTNRDGVLFSATNLAYEAADQAPTLVREPVSLSSNQPRRLTWQEEDVLAHLKRLRARPGQPISPNSLKIGWFPKGEKELWEAVERLGAADFVKRNNDGTALMLTEAGYELIR